MTIKISSDNIQANTLAALGSSVPKISAITYPGNDTAADIAGGQTVTITGTGFNAGANILINGAYVSVVNVVNSTSIEFTAPVLSAGTYTLYVINTDGGTAISIPGISYSGTPTWTTAAGSLASVYETSSISSNVAATGDATVTYSLFSGTLPTNSTLNANTGLISGTAPASSGATTYSFVIRATDGQQQDTDRSFSITINTDVVTWISPANNTTTALNIDSGANLPVTLSANSAAGRSITFSANSLPAGLSISGNTITGTPTTAQTVNSLITATSAVTNRTASQIFNWTVSVANDTYFKNTTALLSGDTFINTTDSSTNNFAVTPVAAPPATNLTPFQGSYSASFNGASQYMTVPNNAAFDLGTGNFTFECWFYIAANSALDPGSQRNAMLMNFFPASGSRTGYEFQISGNASVTGINLAFISWQADSAVSVVGTPATVISQSVWHHAAFVRNGTLTSIYLDGVSIGSGTLSNQTITSGGNNGNIGWANSFVSYVKYFNGYISNLRLVKGTAVYTANFTPSTSPLTAITNTSLLTLQDNRIRDNSNNAFAITNVGGVSINQRTPFETTPSVTLGSTSFNGSSQYMTVTSNAAFNFGTGDFTVEFWFNVQGAGDNTGQHIFQTRDGTNNGILFQYDRTNKTLAVISDTGLTGLITSSNAILDGNWYHTSVTRSGSTIYFFVNGIQIATTTSAQNFNSTTTYISRRFATDGALHYFNGYISNLRVVKGTAVYTSAFTPSTTPLTAISGTSLLTLQSPVPNNNNTFIDSSPNTFAVTRVGTPTQGSVSPFGSNWSNYFDGTGDYFTVPANAAFEFGTGDFTIECWINKPSAVNSNIVDARVSLTAIPWGFYVDESNYPYFYDGTIYKSSVAIVNNVWNHVAVVRTSGVLKIFVNGVQGYSASVTGALNGTGTVNIAGYPAYTTGYISNLRIVKGTAVYTATFTPSTTPLTAISGTSLLTCQSNRLKDNSTNDFTVTKGGDTTVSRFSPFSTTTGYVPSIHGGSMYFSGTGQVLTVADNDAFEISGDFTVETWFYMTVTPAAATTVLSKGASGVYQPYYFTFNSNNTLVFYSSSTGSSWDIASAVSLGAVNINAWNHAAVSRSGSSMRLFLNGALITTITSSAALHNNTTAVAVGGRSDTTELFTGYISNTRIVKGTALYTAAFTPSTTPLTAVTNTSLLLGGTNAGIVDQSMQGNYNTVADSKISSAAVKYGTGAMFFDGTGDYVDFSPPPARAAFGTADFTIEFWVRPVTQVSTYPGLFGNQTFTTNSFVGYERHGSYPNVFSIFCYNYSSVAAMLLSTTTISINTWYHIAVTRSGSSLKLFVNGVNESTVTFSGSVDGGVPLRYIGLDYTTTNAFAGYIDDFRITRGVARYTSNFTPSTTALFTK